MKELIVVQDLGIKVTIGLNKLESELANECWRLVSIVTKE